MSEENKQLPPSEQAIHDYRQGGGLDDCPKCYTEDQKAVYNWQMHKLQVDELKRMREAL